MVIPFQRSSAAAMTRSTETSWARAAARPSPRTSSMTQSRHAHALANEQAKLRARDEAARAEKEKTRAEQEKARADAQAEEARRALYAARQQVAMNAWRENRPEVLAQVVEVGLEVEV